jgi:hypothetical protein
MENKQEICDRLLSALQSTRDLYDLAELRYSRDTETVTATFSSGYSKHANVACDSGIAMIQDIIKQIV